MPVAGQRVLAADFPPVASDVQNTLGATNSATFIESLSAGGPCAVTFVAPTSGKVRLTYACQAHVSVGTGSVIMSVVVRTGGVIGSGTVVLAASDDHGVVFTGAAASAEPMRMGVSHVLSGLTPGATYNVRQAFRALSGATGTWQRKNLIVEPLP